MDGGIEHLIDCDDQHRLLWLGVAAGLALMIAIVAFRVAVVLS